MLHYLHYEYIIIKKVLQGVLSRESAYIWKFLREIISWEKLQINSICSKELVGSRKSFYKRVLHADLQNVLQMLLLNFIV